MCFSCSRLQGQMFIGGAAVLGAAVEAKNGRLYILDGVLTPPSITPVLPHRCDVTETKILKVRDLLSVSIDGHGCSQTSLALLASATLLPLLGSALVG